MNSLEKMENENNKVKHPDIEKKINKDENNIQNNIVDDNNTLKTSSKNKKENNNKNNKIDVKNSEILNNIRDMISMSQEMNKNINRMSNKITKENNKIKNCIKGKTNKNIILLKYEDYKERIKKYNTNNNFTSREKNKKTNFYKSNNKMPKNKLNKDFISVEKMFKKYNSKEWNQIYLKRFKSYQDNINKKKEEKRKFNENEKKRKEDEIINYSNKKKRVSSKKKLDDKKYKPLFIKEKHTLKNNIIKIFNKNYLFYNKNIEENIYNKRYIDEDLENIKNHNIIYYKGNMYNLEEERNILIQMSKSKNLCKSDGFKKINYFDKNEKQDLLKNNNTMRKSDTSETDKLVYEFMIRHLEEKIN